MCLAIPMKVVSIDGSMGKVEAWGVEREADLAMVSPIEIGQYVLVHAGFAIQTMDEQEARETMQALEDMADAMDEYKDQDDSKPQMFHPSGDGS